MIMGGFAPVAAMWPPMAVATALSLLFGVWHPYGERMGDVTSKLAAEQALKMVARLSRRGGKLRQALSRNGNRPG
jgi:hypothetical protein